jgi:hypothetical protein
MLEEIMIKIGLLVCGSMLPFEKIPEAVEFVSDNLLVITLIVLFSLLAIFITGKYNYPTFFTLNLHSLIDDKIIEKMWEFFRQYL